MLIPAEEHGFIFVASQSFHRQNTNWADYFNLYNSVSQFCYLMHCCFLFSVQVCDARDDE